MSKDFASMIKRLGSIVPGFKGYESREELRETDYKLRLHVSNQIEVLVRNIETAKLEMDDLNLMQMDKIQNELKVLATQISNQTYGYKSMMHRENDDYLQDVISNDYPNLLDQHIKLNETLGFADNQNGIYKSFLGENNFQKFISLSRKLGIKIFFTEWAVFCLYLWELLRFFSKKNVAHEL